MLTGDRHRQPNKHSAVSRTYQNKLCRPPPLSLTLFLFAHSSLHPILLFSSLQISPSHYRLNVNKMGKFLSKIFGSKEIRILMLGLDASGKTSKHAFTRFHNIITTFPFFLPFASNSVQIKVWPTSHHHPYRRLQCRDCNV